MNITTEAAEAIQSLLWDKKKLGGGLRIFIATPKDEGAGLDFGLAITTHPDPTDEVIAGHGSRVFVERRLLPVLADKTLDVVKDDDEERIGFRLVS